VLDNDRVFAMKNKLLAFLLAGLACLPAYAASHSHDAHAGHGAVPQPAQSAWVDGVVKRVDKAGGRVTVAHGPLTQLNMPAMTMVFRVRDASWLDRMRVDGKIRFVAESIGGTLTIVQFEPEK
jgi:Cu/Ag efflux protein CusF